MSDYAWLQLTDRQQKRLEKIAVELASHGMNVKPQDFDIDPGEKYRPGRGGNINWWVYDEEKVAQGRLDVYGNGNGYGVAEVIWTHTGADCDCDVCVPPDGDDGVHRDIVIDLQRVAPGREIETVQVAGGVL